MKRIKFTLFIISLFFLSCSKRNDSITINEDKSISKLKAAVVTPTPSPNAYISRFESENTDLDSMKPGTFHKLRGDLTKGPIDTIVTANLAPGQEAYGLTKFPFVKGKEYTLTFPINLEGYDDKSFLEVSSKSYFPEIEIYTIKNLNGSGLSTQYINPPLKSTNDVFQKISIPGPQDINKHQSRTITLKFIPDACFQFIGFKFRSNVSKNTKIHLKTPTISAKSLMEFVAEPEQCIGTTQVVAYRTSSGYIINEPVNWYVKGDLEIIGSTNGANVTIKSKGTGIGTVGYYPCDSSLGSFEFNIKPPKEDFEISGKPIVRPLETLVYYLPADIGLSNITFQVGGATVLGTTENSVRIRVLNKAYDSLPIVSITATGNTKCGLFTKTLYPDVIEN